jgi:coenzyme F420-reducing hydrogenase delta subunit
MEEKVKKHSGNGAKLFQLNCVANILPNTIIEAMTNGADVIFILSCAEGCCRYHDGDEKIEKVSQGLEAMIMDFGLEPERLMICRAEPYEEDPVQRVLNDSRARADEVGPSPFKQGGA